MSTTEPKRNIILPHSITTKKPRGTASFNYSTLWLELNTEETKNKPSRDFNVSAIRIPALFIGIGTPKRRANVGVMSTCIPK